MEHKIINTEKYLLIVGDSEIKEGDWYYLEKVGIIGSPSGIYKSSSDKSSKLNTIADNCKKIIAHLPLNDSPILDGVDLLPPIEDEAKKWARSQFSCEEGDYEEFYYIGLETGYRNAKEKYKYTEDDLIKAISLARELENWEDIEYKYYGSEIIQSLNQPKLPIGFKCEMEYKDMLGYWYIIDEITKESVKKFDLKTRVKTTTNLQGQTEWVGEYIY